MSDRRVHAVLSDGTEIVRYDKAGKWYAEKKLPRYSDQSKSELSRQKLTLADATRAVLRDADSEIRVGVPGGRLFDKAVGG